MSRIHVAKVSLGEVTLDPSQSHHVRDVLRLKIGSAVELFEDGGNVGEGVITNLDRSAVAVRIESIHEASGGGELVVASAVPKGERADWMIEKLSELGVTRFIPLMTERSVVHPAGSNKRDRWMRLATESAKQSRRGGVMRIDELMPLAEAIKMQSSGESGWYLSTTEDALPIGEAIARGAMVHTVDRLSLFIGPEGGWSELEISRLNDAGLTGVKLTATILRVETAAISGAAIAATMMLPR
jgi:16S rRNA (uracil1498-N3)-methyltransferase